MIFRQLFEHESSTYTYILADEQTKEAVIIDPVKETVERDMKLIEELGLQLLWILDTHIHADHITGAAGLRKYFNDVQYVVSQASGVTCADRLLVEGDIVEFGKYSINVLETPGHTDNSLSYLCNGKLFTGDALLIRGCGRTDFQSGSSETLYKVVHEKIFSLPKETEIYPAHDYKGHEMSTVEEEKNHNPRLAHTTLEEFVEIMENLNLPKPKKIDESVPGNMRCGEVEVASSGHVRQG